MIKEVSDGGFYDFYGINLFFLEAVTEKLIDRIDEIDKRREEMCERKLCDNVRYRIKSPESMKAKLKKRGFPQSAESAMNNVFDAAGIRIICPYIDDVYIVAETLSKQSDINVVEVKDYIKNPKKNGYRSYHMIVETPIQYMGETHFVKAEIQIRTMVMNSWASAEHQLKYKKEHGGDVASVEMLRKCAEEMLQIDYSMMKIRNMMQPDEKVNVSSGAI
jgi:putative GTP pyrophosphokinase